MDKIIRDTLFLLSLSTKEVSFMLASYKSGPASITTLGKQARLERSTAYLVAEQLLEKGYLKEDYKSYKKQLVAVEPKDLYRMLSAKQRVVRRQEMLFEERLAELQEYAGNAHTLPKVTVFKGKNALVSVWRDVLGTKGEILLWTNQKTESQIFSKELHEKFINERVRKRLPIRVLAVNNEPGKLLQEKDELSLRHSKLLPLQTSFNAETYLYNHTIAMLDYQTDTIGVVINSEAMASTQRAIFEMTWEGIGE